MPDHRAENGEHMKSPAQRRAERVLQAHGVGPESVEQEFVRPREAIDAIIADIQLANHRARRSIA